MNIKELDKALAKHEQKQDPKLLKVVQEQECKELEEFVNMFISKHPNKRVFTGGDNLKFTFYK